MSDDDRAPRGRGSGSASPEDVPLLPPSPPGNPRPHRLAEGSADDRAPRERRSALGYVPPPLLVNSLRERVTNSTEVDPPIDVTSPRRRPGLRPRSDEAARRSISPSPASPSKRAHLDDGATRRSQPRRPSSSARPHQVDSTGSDPNAPGTVPVMQQPELILTELEPDGGTSLESPQGDEEGNRSDGAAMMTATDDLISKLQEDMKLQILTFLPLKAAIRMAGLSRGWLDLWVRRWQDGRHPTSVRYHLRTGAPISPGKLHKLLQGRQGHPLHHFSLIVETSRMTDKLFTDCLQYIAKCNVRDLNIEVRRPALITKLNFNFVEASNLLVRVSLCGIIVSDFNHVGAQPFNNLKVMNLHSVRVNDTILMKVVALCPCLHVLDLRNCNNLTHITVTAEWPNVRSLTIMDCSRVLKVDAMAISSIRSFHFKGGNASFYLQGDAFTDLYMYLDYRTTICCLISTEWFDNTIGKTSKLTALTICSNTLQSISLLLNDGRLPQLAKVNFQMLTELQLIIDDKQPVDLDSIFTFLRNCQCPNLKKIFVQLSTISDVQGVDDSRNLVKNRPAVGLENLEIVKITNLTWNNLQMQLVNFLFSQAINLHKMFLVSPNPFPLNMPGVLKEAVDKGQIVLTKSDDAMCRSFHSEAFANL